MSNHPIELANTFGIEIETEMLFPQVSITGFRGTHDASIETPVIFVNDIALKPDGVELLRQFVPVSGGDSHIGVEYYSEIMSGDDPEHIRYFNNITKVMTELGEPPTSTRSGIHFHVSCHQPGTRTLKSIIRLARHLEKIFFIIGGMGYEFRGVANDSIYCRPITKFGPTCIPYNGRWTQVFNVNDLVSPSTVNAEMFWHKYGDCYNHQTHYNPVRYHWINLWPMYPGSDHKGTLEFRIFNKTLNAYYIEAALQLCLGFTRLAISSGFQKLKEDGFLSENSVYDDTPKDTLRSTLDRFIDKADIKNEWGDELLKIFDLSPVPKLKKEYVKSHVLVAERRRDLNNYWTDSYYKPEPVNTQVKDPDFVDIHRLRREM